MQCLNYLTPFRNVFDLDFSCKFMKLQYNSLAFVAGSKRATDEGSLPEIAQYSPCYLPLNVVIASKGSNLYILYSIQARPQGCNYLPKAYGRKHMKKKKLL